MAKKDSIEGRPQRPEATEKRRKKKTAKSEKGKPNPGGKGEERKRLTAEPPWPSDLIPPHEGKGKKKNGER